jgi:hypothetical protein
MRQKIYTLKDFDFKPHNVVKGAVQGLLKLPNNITVSIVGGGLQSIVGGMNRLRGDGVDTFEIAAWWDTGRSIDDDWIKLSDYDDVLSYVDKDRLPIILLDLSKK